MAILRGRLRSIRRLGINSLQWRELARARAKANATLKRKARQLKSESASWSSELARGPAAWGCDRSLWVQNLLDLDVNLVRATAVACSAFGGIALLSPRPAWRPLHLMQPDLVGHSSAALQPHLLLCGVAACIAWRFALRALRACLRYLSLRSATDVSSKKRALKLGGVEVKIRAKQQAKLVQERRPRFDDTPTPLAREKSDEAVSLQHCAATSIAQGREAPPLLKAVKRLSRHTDRQRKIDFYLKIVPEKSST